MRHLATSLTRFLALALAAAAVAVAGPTPVFINEVHYDNLGGDTGEFVEVAGPAGTDLAGWSLALYNSTSADTYATISLSGTIPAEQGSYGAVAFYRSGIQNGPADGLALVDDGGALVQFLCYEGTFTATGGPAAGTTCADLGVAESSSTPVGYSLQLTGTGAAYENFAWSAPAPETPGAVNAGQTFSGGPLTACPAPFSIGKPGVVSDGYRASPSDAEYVAVETVQDLGLTGLYLIVFDAFTEKVTHSQPFTGRTGTGAYRIGASGVAAADEALPDGTLPDGPGAIAVVTRAVPVGADVGTIDRASELCASVVYLNNTLAFGAYSTPPPAASKAGTAAAPDLRLLLQEARQAAGAGDLPTAFALGQNYPNPFNPATRIAFTLPEAAEARLVVYDLLGREVARLADGLLEAGTHEVRFDGHRFPSGTYVYRLTAGASVQTRQMVLLK